VDVLSWKKMAKKRAGFYVKKVGDRKGMWKIHLGAGWIGVPGDATSSYLSKRVGPLVPR